MNRDEGQYNLSQDYDNPLVDKGTKARLLLEKLVVSNTQVQLQTVHHFYNGIDKGNCCVRC